MPDRIEGFVGVLVVAVTVVVAVVVVAGIAFVALGHGGFYARDRGAGTLLGQRPARWPRTPLALRRRLLLAPAASALAAALAAPAALAAAALAALTAPAAAPPGSPFGTHGCGMAASAAAADSAERPNCDSSLGAPSCAFHARAAPGGESGPQPQQRRQAVRALRAAHR